MGRMTGLLVGLMALVVAAWVGLQYLGGPSDEVLIKSTLAEATKSSASGEPGPVLAAISRTFEVGGQRPSREDISRFIKQYRPRVSVEDVKPVLQGDRAEVVAPVTLTVGVLGMEVAHRIDNVRIAMRRELSFRWGILPTRAWRIETISAPSVDLGSFGGF